MHNNDYIIIKLYWLVIYLSSSFFTYILTYYLFFHIISIMPFISIIDLPSVFDLSPIFPLDISIIYLSLYLYLSL